MSWGKRFDNLPWVKAFDNVMIEEGKRQRARKEGRDVLGTLPETNQQGSRLAVASVGTLVATSGAFTAWQADIYFRGSSELMLAKSSHVVAPDTALPATLAVVAGGLTVLFGKLAREVATSAAKERASRPKAIAENARSMTAPSAAPQN